MDATELAEVIQAGQQLCVFSSASPVAPERFDVLPRFMIKVFIPISNAYRET